jgi:hypothetical protein
LTEQRRHGRDAHCIPALISFRDCRRRATMLRCIVHDQSSEGARIEIKEPYVVPFEFIFTASGSLPRRARKVWVRQNEMGLQFTG